MELLDADLFWPIIGAIVASAIIGAEREYRASPAGLRTHILVGLSCCLLMLSAVHQMAWLNDAPLPDAGASGRADVVSTDAAGSAVPAWQPGGGPRAAPCRWSPPMRWAAGRPRSPADVQVPGATAMLRAG